MKDIFRDIVALAGVEPSTDSTPQSTEHFVYAEGIRFIDGYPHKIGGWQAVSFDDGSTIEGCARTIFSRVSSGEIQYIIATDTNLYNAFSSQLVNITPLVVTPVAIANSLATYYKTLGTDPITTVSGSNILTIADTATRVRAGDTVVLSGSSSVNGIPDTQINATLFVRSQSTNSYTVQVSSSASSSGSGGGASVVQTTAIITITQAAHGRSDGARILLAAAATMGGIPNTEINAEHIIRNVSTNTMDIIVATEATSSVSSAGGASTTIRGEIPAGECDSTFGVGYGLGEYGIGLYGVPKNSSIPISPRVWSVDSYGTDIIATPGQQTGVYLWDNDLETAPALLPNAPTAVNYVFVSNQIVVTLGAAGVGNRIQSSDNLDITVWTATAQNQAYLNDVAEASSWVSHAPSRGLVLLFTDSQVFTFRYIGRPGIWEVQLLDNNSGIISQNARVTHNGVVYWMGTSNLYMYRGGNVEIIPSNTTSETTLKQYVYGNLNYTQKDKIFAWFNEDYNEVWIHYPSADSLEPDRLIRINVLDFTHTPDIMDRTAAEYPAVLGRYPYLISSANTLYKHELGFNADTASLPFALTTPYYTSGKDLGNFKGFIPDSIQSGDIEVTLNIKEYPQSTSAAKGPYTVSPTTNMVAFETAARYWQYEITGDTEDQEWSGGRWQEIIAKGSRQ